MIIDAHQHFWSLGRGDYAFPRPDDPTLYRDFLPADLQPILASAGVDATVVVQATDTLEETAYLLRLAEETPFVAGVVGWCDPRAPETVDRLQALPGSKRLVGVRPMLQRYDDVDWLLGDPSLRTLERLADLRWSFDALVDVRHLAVLREICARVPRLRVVVNHMGKPWRYPDRISDWAAGMRVLSGLPGCFVKVSGFPFAAGSHPPGGELADLVGKLRAWFGVDRLMWGSDWPVVQREGGYPLALAAIQALVPERDTDAVFGRNAASFYGLPEAG
jgi:L-fuconolactonase